MPEPAWGRVTRRELIEHITLLWTLNEVPETPCENDPPSTLDRRRHLNLQREKEITENLAFLSAVTEDSKRVTAICIEEHAGGAGLTIRVASNAGELERIEEGLNQIARVLEDAAKRTHSKAEDSRRLLRQVVIVDYSRILSRLRSRHAPRKIYGKIQPALIPQLNAAVQRGSIRPNNDISANTIAELRTRATDLQALFERFEAIGYRGRDVTRSQQELGMEVLECVHQLKSLNALTAALSGSPEIESTLRDHLPRAVGKLGRYYSTSGDLIKFARDRDYRVFNRVLVETCRISGPSRVLVSNPLPFDLALQNIHSSANNIQRQRLAEYLETDMTQADEMKYSSRLICKNSSWKVHAEIQLLLYYELHPTVFQARVICSSKSACYLCDLFFKLHGKFWTRNAHRKLYDKWILPDTGIGLSDTSWRNLCSIVEQMDAVLKAKIMFNLTNRQRYNHPNESVLIPTASYSSSNNSVRLGSVEVASPLEQTFSDIPQTNRAEHEELRSPSPYSDSSVLTLVERSPHGTIPPATDPDDPHQALPPPAPSPPTQHPPTTRPSVPTLLAPDLPVLDAPAPDLPASPQPVIHSAHATPPISPRIPTQILENISRVLEETALTDAPPLADANEFRAPDMLPYKQLDQGQILWKDLSDPNTVFKAGSPKIHLSLTRDSLQLLTGSSIATANAPSVGARTGERCWVKVRWLDEMESGRVHRDSISVNDLAPGLEIMLENGAASVDKELFLSKGRDVISVKYTFEQP